MKLRGWRIGSTRIVHGRSRLDEGLVKIAALAALRCAAGPPLELIPFAARSDLLPPRDWAASHRARRSFCGGGARLGGAALGLAAIYSPLP